MICPTCKRKALDAWTPDGKCLYCPNCKTVSPTAETVVEAHEKWVKLEGILARAKRKGEK